VSVAIEHARAVAMEKALAVYYAAEELARDPEHAELIPLVEKTSSTPNIKTNKKTTSKLILRR
jgi:hypothetical protein